VRIGTVRSILLGMIVVGFLGSAIALWIISAEGALSRPSWWAAFQQLVGLYIPAAGIFIGLAVAGRFAIVGTSLPGGEQQISWIAALLGMFLTGLWTLTPPLVLLFSRTIESAILIFGTVGLFGEVVGAAAVTYYFVHPPAVTARSKSRAPSR
jgi:hypothetical protein